MTEARIYKYPVPIDNQWHKHTITSPHDLGIVYVDMVPRSDVLNFYAANVEGEVTVDMEFKAFATGEVFDLNETYYVGSLRDGIFVWHLLCRDAVSDGLAERTLGAVNEKIE